MWVCPKCRREFLKKGQIHSCRRIPLEKHFEGKGKAKELFDYLLAEVNQKVGRCQLISLPCCVHLFGKYDFLAALPKKKALEIRFVLNRKLKTPRLKICVPLSKKSFKNCFLIRHSTEIDQEMLGWIKESYTLKA